MVILSMRKIVLILAVFTSMAAKSQTIITDRPDQTESPQVVPAGTLQYEGGMLVEWDQHNTERMLLPTSLFRIALHKRVELRLVHELGFDRSSNDFTGETIKTRGTTDVQLGMKVQLSGFDASQVAVGLLSHVSLPSGSFNLDESWMQSHKICLALPSNGDWSMAVNVGWMRSESQNEIQNQGLFTLALGHAINDQLGLYVETYGALSESGVDEFSGDAGLTWLVHDRLQLDWSFGVGFNQRMNYSSIGLSWLSGQ
jgi:hypothetical protein